VFALRDVYGHAAHAKRLAVRAELDRAAGRNPSYGSIRRHDPVLDGIVIAALQRPVDRLAGRLAVFRIDRVDESREIDRFGLLPAKKTPPLIANPDFVARYVPYSDGQIRGVGCQTQPFLAFPQPILHLLTFRNIQHEAAKLDGLTIALLAVNNIVHPYAFARRCNHSIFECKVRGTRAVGQTGVDGKFLIVGMEMRNPKILLIPLFKRVA
jgi:hypothetical protein